MSEPDARPTTPPTPQPAGLLVEFDDVQRWLDAARRVREAGYTRFDAMSPCPVHGIDKAMGVRATRLPWIVLGCGLAGATTGFLLQWWTNAVNYPFIIGGKPFLSLPSDIPIMFELTILFAAFGAVLGMLGLNRLPELYHPAFRSERFRRVTSDRYFILIDATDPRYDEAQTRALADSLGGTGVEALED